MPKKVRHEAQLVTGKHVKNLRRYKSFGDREVASHKNTCAGEWNAAPPHHHTLHALTTQVQPCPMPVPQRDGTRTMMTRQLVICHGIEGRGVKERRTEVDRAEGGWLGLLSPLL
jgi:hypothetical protein